MKEIAFWDLPVEQQWPKLATEDEKFAALPHSEQRRALNILADRLRSYRQDRALEISAVALAPPLILYAFAFIVAPWVKRGFSG